MRKKNTCSTTKTRTRMTADEARKLVEKAEKRPKIDKALYKEAIAEIKEAASK